MGVARDRPPSDDWSAEEWQARADHAAAHLSADPKWKVGAEVVRMYQFGAERAREREAS